MTELQVFQNEEFGQVRTLEIDSIIWFVAVDVCKALEIANARQAVSRLDEDERLSTVISNDSAVGRSNTNLINESGLYGLILGSRKPEAKAFKRWITHDVIPAIRKTGSYSVPQAEPSLELPAVIEIRRKRQLSSQAPILRVTAEAFTMIEILSASSGLSLTQAASELIIKAYPLVKVTD